jgi:hypothetical protein
MSDGLTSFQQAELHALRAQNRGFELGLTPQDIRGMDWDEFHRLIGVDRPTPAQLALAEHQRQQDSRSTSPATNGTPAPTDVPVPASGPQGIDLTDPEVIRSMTREQLIQHRVEINAANGIRPAAQNTGSPSGGFGRGALSSSNVERPKVSSREDIARGLQAARDAEAARLAWLRTRGV